METYAKVIAKHEISPFFAAKLRKLENYDIVYVCDDSGSMNTNLAVHDMKTAAVTRWNEAQSIIAMTVELAALMNPKNGISVYFLNRPDLHCVTDKAQLEATFRNPPAGYTPLTRTLRRVFEDKKATLPERPVLIIVVTDGEPTTDTGASDKDNFTRLLLSRPTPTRTPMSFLVCTEDNGVVAFLNKLDTEVECMDVVDDYESERKEVVAVQGGGFHFSRGDYVVKCLLGSIDPELDTLDEIAIGSSSSSSSSSSVSRVSKGPRCCIL
jgi:hypothetical protein